MAVAAAAQQEAAVVVAAQREAEGVRVMAAVAAAEREDTGRTRRGMTDERPCRRRMPQHWGRGTHQSRAPLHQRMLKSDPKT